MFGDKGEANYQDLDFALMADSSVGGESKAFFLPEHHAITASTPD
jgi:hypothetical protein